ncbi:MAG: hypothetical protein ACE37H_09770 [Phycisphaeraceae bacterium]
MPPTQEHAEQLILCPYCGHAQFGGERCQACSGLFEPLSRRATQLAMGPWQVRDKQQPFKPGCCYDIVKKLAAAGKIKSTTVMRGPTTRQFWSIARNVPGVAHLIGYCHACGAHVSPSDAKCGKCNAVFTEPRERNALGLIFKDDEEARKGQLALDAELRGEAPPPRPTPGPTKRPAPRAAKPGDLLAEVLDLSGDAREARPRVNAPVTNAVRPAATAIEFAAPPANAPQAPAPTSAFDVEPTGPLPEGGGISPMVLLLVALNIIALGAIVVFVLMSR